MWVEYTAIRQGSVPWPAPSQAQDSSPLVLEPHKTYCQRRGWSRLQIFRNNPKWTFLHITLIQELPQVLSRLNAFFQGDHLYMEVRLLSAACVSDCQKTPLNSKWRFRKNHPPGFSLRVSLRSNTQMQPRCLLRTLPGKSNFLATPPHFPIFPTSCLFFQTPTKKCVLPTVSLRRIPGALWTAFRSGKHISNLARNSCLLGYQAPFDPKDIYS